MCKIKLGKLPIYVLRDTCGNHILTWSTLVGPFMLQAFASKEYQGGETPWFVKTTFATLWFHISFVSIIQSMMHIFSLYGVPPIRHKSMNNSANKIAFDMMKINKLRTEVLNVLVTIKIISTWPLKKSFWGVDPISTDLGQTHELIKALLFN